MSASPADPLIDAAVAAHQQGRVAEAECGYRAALEVEPDHPDALHLLGLLCHQQARYDEAKPLLRAAAEADPETAAFQYGLAEALRLSGQPGEAVPAYERAVTLDANLVDAWRGLGIACQQTGRFADAAEAFGRAAALDSAHAETCNNLAVSLRHLGRPEAAVEWLQKAILLAPGFVDAHENLVRAYTDLGRFAEAVSAARALVAVAPVRLPSLVALAGALYDVGSYGEAAAVAEAAAAVDGEAFAAHYILAAARERQRDFAGAASAFGRCVELRPNRVDSVINLGAALAHLGRHREAVARFRAAIALAPGGLPAKLNLASCLGTLREMKEAIAVAEDAAEQHPHDANIASLAATLLTDAGEPGRAATHYRRAMALAPLTGAWAGNYAAMLVQTGQMRQAMEVYRQALELDPNMAVAHSGMLLFLNADAEATPEQVRAEHERWASLHAAPMGPAPRHDNDPTPDRRLRIGYVSPDLRGHSVAYFLEPLLSAHDHKRFEIVVYDDVAQPDTITVHLRQFADQWNRVVGMPHEAFADRVRADRIDILVDLAGHTGGNRLLAMARKPAPVQVSYLGYPNTTGVPAIDYRVTDAIADPPGLTDAFHTEKLVRLPRPFLVYHPPGGSPEVGPLPALANHRITFAAFNALWKLHPGVVEAWCRVLSAVPASRLLMKGTGLGDASVRERFFAAFEHNGIDPARIELLGREPEYRKHMGVYNRCDIALDTFPYNGTTTTCEAMWMGVPVVAIAGGVHAARVGASLLDAVGLGRLVAKDVDDYVRIATELAADLPGLDRLRREMRGRLLRSPLMDRTGIARAMEGAYLRMWWDWCARQNRRDASS